MYAVYFSHKKMQEAGISLEIDCNNNLIMHFEGDDRKLDAIRNAHKLLEEAHFKQRDIEEAIQHLVDADLIRILIATKD